MKGGVERHNPFILLKTRAGKLSERNLPMSATQERSRPNIWAVGVRQVVYMALGAALYGALSYLTNFLQLPSVGNVSVRPAIVIPLFFGAVFGPIVGLITGGLGNF